MKILKALIYQKHWFNRKFAVNIVRDFFGVLGFIWFILEFSSFFLSYSDQQRLKAHLLVYLIIAFVLAFLKNFPRSSYSFKIRDRDSWVELRIGDAFRIGGDVVVPFNNMYDASIGGRAAKAPTMQGALIREFFDGDASKLQSEIDSSLAQNKVDITKTETGYPLGTVIPISIKNRTAYLFVTSVLEENNRARGSAEDISHCLPLLWLFIKEEGDKGKLVVPAIGTGHARTILKREEMVEKLVETFVESCSDCVHCNKLVIVLRPEDVIEHRIDVQYLRGFVAAYCEYARFS